MITLLLLTMLIAQPVDTVKPPTENCAVSYTDDKGKTASKVIPMLHVAGTDPKNFQIPKIDEGKVTTLMCARASLVPDSSDWVVLNAGLPFYIRADDRLLALEIVHNQLQARIVQGALTSEEKELMQARLNELQLHFNKQANGSSVHLRK